ncbi:MAG: class I SAM-dependent DNA methyltransferase [Gammaproteobacteria bacterium]
MANHYSQTEINTALWAACNSFRNGMDALMCKNYILVMFLLKYMSDVWKDHQQQFENTYGQNTQRTRRRLARERFVIPVIEVVDSRSGAIVNRHNADFYSLFDLRNASDIGERVNRVLNALEEANERKLRGVFREIDFCSQPHLGRSGERNRRIRQLLEDMNRPVFDMRPSTIPESAIANICRFINECFAYELDKKADGGQISQAAASLVIKLAQPHPGETICDPVCREGNLLIEAAQKTGSKDIALYGMELSSSNGDIARINMYMHGLDFARIETCNALTSPALVENDHLMKFDVVMGYLPSTNAEWGQLETENDIYRRFWRGTLPKSKVEYAMICHMIETAEEKHGRVVIVVPHGVLFRGGAEARIRKKLIEENSLIAVIGLPCQIFPAGGLPVAALVFDRSREKGGANENISDVLFIDANQKAAHKAGSEFTESDLIEQIYTTVVERKVVNNFSYLASAEEISENKFNLNISRYVNTSSNEDSLELAQIQKSTMALEKEIAETRAEIMTAFKKLIDNVEY